MQKIKTNKHNLKGDLHHNWERHLIEANPTMKKDHTAVLSAVNVWFREYSDNKYFTILPECIETICAEFYVHAKCGKCGQYEICKESDKELYLNLYDGFIGCSRYFINQCSLKHWEEYERKNKNIIYEWSDFKWEVDDILNMSLVVNLSTIGKYGANVWCYPRHQYVNYTNDKTDKKEMKNSQLEKLLNHWGIRMTEFKWFIPDKV